MHSKRVLSALVFVPLFYAYIILLPAEYFLLLLALLSTAALAEFYSISGVGGGLRYLGIICGVGILAASMRSKELFAAALILSVLLLTAFRLFTKRDPSGSLSELSAAAFGLLYVPGLLAFQLDIARSGSGLLVLLYTSVWVADSMAFYIGKGLGRRKLYAEVSPNKTVAGAAGSVLGGIIAAIGVKAVLLQQVSFLNALLIGAGIGIVSIVGDLVESMLKRDAGVKDSSGLIPGHGGVLDKIDSFTFAGPVLYFLCIALGIIK